LNLAEYLGLPSHSSLSRLPSWCVAYPWAEVGPHAMKRWLPSRIARQRKAAGFDIPRYWSKNKIMEFASKNAAVAQFTQFQSLLSSIATRGFLNHCNRRDPLSVDKLRDGNEEVWVIHSGFHRTCVASALELTEIHAEYRLVVDRRNVKFWPQVVNGSFTEHEALSVFDSLFFANLLPRTKDFLDSSPNA